MKNAISYVMFDTGGAERLLYMVYVMYPSTRMFIKLETRSLEFPIGIDTKGKKRGKLKVPGTFASGRKLFKSAQKYFKFGTKLLG